MASSEDDAAAAERLYQALEMWELGVQMMTENLRRRHPDATPAEIDRMVDDWLASRPGDADGVPVDLSRFR